MSRFRSIRHASHKDRPEVVVVGPCGSGKSTLVAALEARGYAARAVAQEHSVIPDLWRHAGKPAVLIMLEAEQATITERRGADFPSWLLRQQRERLASAREHANLRVVTDDATPEQVLTRVVEYLQRAGLYPQVPGS